MTLKRYYYAYNVLGGGTIYKQYILRPGSVIKSISCGKYSTQAAGAYFMYAVADGAITTVANGNDWNPIVWFQTIKCDSAVGHVRQGSAEGGLEIPLLSGTMTIVMYFSAAAGLNFVSVVVDEPEGWNPAIKTAKGV